MSLMTCSKSLVTSFLSECSASSLLPGDWALRDLGWHRFRPLFSEGGKGPRSWWSTRGGHDRTSGEEGRGPGDTLEPRPQPGAHQEILPGSVSQEICQWDLSVGSIRRPCGICPELPSVGRFFPIGFLKVLSQQRPDM